MEHINILQCIVFGRDEDLNDILYTLFSGVIRLGWQKLKINYKN